jgi:hypothetical protein
MDNPLKESPKRRNPLKQGLGGVKRFNMEQQHSLTAGLDNRTYFDTYLPVPSQSPSTQIIPELILDCLKNERMYENNTWAKIPGQTQGGSNVGERGIYKGLVKVLERVRELTEKNLPNLKRVPGKWIDTSDVALQTWSRSGVTGLKPDISFIHDKTDKNEVKLLLTVPEIFRF